MDAVKYVAIAIAIVGVLLYVVINHSVAEEKNVVCNRSFYSERKPLRSKTSTSGSKSIISGSVSGEAMMPPISSEKAGRYITSILWSSCVVRGMSCLRKSAGERKGDTRV